MILGMFLLYYMSIISSLNFMGIRVCISVYSLSSVCFRDIWTRNFSVLRNQSFIVNNPLMQHYYFILYKFPKLSTYFSGSIFSAAMENMYSTSLW